MAFDSTSVKRNTTAPPNAVYFNFPIGPGEVYAPSGGVFRARNLPLATYITFAYKISPSHEEIAFSQLPKWVTTDRFDIDGKAQGNPTKDQMRLMVQSLLADRFRLAVHYETRQLPVFALVLDKPGQLGSQLQKHADDAPCPAPAVVPSPAPTTHPVLRDTRFPASCGGIIPMPPSRPGRYRSGARDVTMDLIASSMGGMDRPVIDKTGLPGKYDYSMEYAPSRGNSQPDPSGPTLAQALREQLGLKLVPQTGLVDVVIVDYAEQPAAN